jgi:Ni/Co efflux regulator RcnB
MNPKDADINWKDRKIATKIKPSITNPKVDRLDRNTTVPNFLKKDVEEEKVRLDPKCWTGKHKEGTKIKGGVRVNNCVPNEGVEEGFQNDESNLWYIFDNADARLKQRMIPNDSELTARRLGYRDTPEAALKVAGIIRSKFNPKKFVQKQGASWVEVHPFGIKEEPANDSSSPVGGMKEDSKPVHRIGLVVTDPNHPMVSKRNDTIQKTARVTGGDREKAINSAIAHYRRKGFKVHDHHYLGLENPVAEDQWHGQGDEWHGTGDQWSSEGNGGGAAPATESKVK